MGFGIRSAIRSFTSQAQRTFQSATAGLRPRSATPPRPKPTAPRTSAPKPRATTPARTTAPARRPANPLGGLLNAVRNPRATLNQLTRAVADGTRPLRQGLGNTVNAVRRVLPGGLGGGPQRALPSGRTQTAAPSRSKPSTAPSRPASPPPQRTTAPQTRAAPPPSLALMRTELRPAPPRNPLQRAWDWLAEKTGVDNNIRGANQMVRNMGENARRNAGIALNAAAQAQGDFVKGGREWAEAHKNSSNPAARVLAHANIAVGNTAQAVHEAGTTAQRFYDDVKGPAGVAGRLASDVFMGATAPLRLASPKLTTRERGGAIVDVAVDLVAGPLIDGAGHLAKGGGRLLRRGGGALARRFPGSARTALRVATQSRHLLGKAATALSRTPGIRQAARALRQVDPENLLPRRWQPAERALRQKLANVNNFRHPNFGTAARPEVLPINAPDPVARRITQPTSPDVSAPGAASRKPVRADLTGEAPRPPARKDLPGEAPRNLLPPATSPDDPLVAWHARPRAQRIRPPEPVIHQGQRYDVTGVLPDGRVRLEPANVRSKFLQREDLLTGNRQVEYRGQQWRLTGMDGEAWGASARRRSFVLQPTGQPGQPSTPIKVDVSDASQISFRFSKGGEVYNLGDMRHGVMRLTPQAADDAIYVPGDQVPRFQARLKGRELEGAYDIERLPTGQLRATGVDRKGVLRTFDVRPDDIASRYVRVQSPDFGRQVKVDAFTHREATLRATAERAPGTRPLRDPAFGTLPTTVTPRMDPGGTSLQRMVDVLRDPKTKGDVTVFNIGFSADGPEKLMRDALLEYRQRNPGAKIRVMVYEPSWGSFPNNRLKLDPLFSHPDVNIQVVFPPRQSTRTVIHAKGLVAGDRVVLSTAAVIEKTLKKLDVTTELPPQAAGAYKRYMELVASRGSNRVERQKLLGELAKHGVVVNDPVVRAPYVARAIDSLVTGANRSIRFTGSELRDVATTRKLIAQASRGLDVHIQYREIDPASKRLLQFAQKKYPNLKVEDVTNWKPYPHFNAVVADDQQVYVGTAYLWSNQLKMVQHGVSYENGVLLDGDSAKSFLRQLRDFESDEWVRNGGRPPPPPEPRPRPNLP
jgi:hypothetical protein